MSPHPVEQLDEPNPLYSLFCNGLGECLNFLAEWPLGCNSSPCSPTTSVAALLQGKPRFSLMKPGAFPFQGFFATPAIRYDLDHGLQEPFISRNECRCGSSHIDPGPRTGSGVSLRNETESPGPRSYRLGQESPRQECRGTLSGKTEPGARGAGMVPKRSRHGQSDPGRSGLASKPGILPRFSNHSRIGWKQNLYSNMLPTNTFWATTYPEDRS